MQPARRTSRTHGEGVHAHAQGAHVHRHVEAHARHALLVRGLHLVHLLHLLEVLQLLHVLQLRDNERGAGFEVMDEGEGETTR